MPSEPLARRRFLLGLGGLLLLTGCAGAPQRVDPAGRPVALDAPGLAMRGRFRPAPDAGRLWVVIEGDGAHWRHGRPPADPTPRRPAGPAILDILPPGDARLWLARPCQYLEAPELAGCDPRYWAQDRFAPPVLAAYQRLIDRHAAGRTVGLIGFSGGGVLAAELALSRPDAGVLITLAAPLDLLAWTAHHGVPPVTGPRPPGRMLRDLARARLPMLHLFGGRDRVVPPFTQSRLRAALPASRTAIVPHAGHDADWAGILSNHPSAQALFATGA